MDSDEFIERGKEMVEYIANYINSQKNRRVTPSVEPGYLRKRVPDRAPMEPENWDTIMDDVEKLIIPGLTNWSHPNFHAYFPSGNSYPSILGELLSAGLGCIGFSWAASPACTELETIVLDWMGKAIGLPKSFLALEKGSSGGGCIEGSASECVLVAMVAARASAIKRLKCQYPNVDESLLLSKLIAYCSKEAHSCVEKGAMICFVKMRILQPDENNVLRGETLRQAMVEDEEAGRVPFFVATTLGTTSVCSFDALEEIGPVCRRFPAVWLHVDAAYAGCGFICPELKQHLAGVEYADSFNTNPNKWLMTNFDCSLLWVRNRYLLTSALVVDPIYLQHGYDSTAIDYRHWGVPLSRRFRSLKLWFVIRRFGIKGLQSYIRNHVMLAKYFESLVRKDGRFQICNEVKLGLVCFRLRGFEGQSLEEANKLNQKLLTIINASGRVHMVPARVHDTFIIRFAVCAEQATKEDIDDSWEVITEFATEILETPDKERELPEVSDELTRRRREILARKRSFFVRMVSDPKIYNPGISTTPPPFPVPPSPGPQEKIITPTTPSSSWISWPLAFFFQSNDDSGNDLPIRFRHLDTMVRLKSPGPDSRRGSTPSPDRDSTKHLQHKQ